MRFVCFPGWKENCLRIESKRSLTIWVSQLDGSDSKLISHYSSDQDADLRLPIEQKVPTWSPDGKWIAHWEGVEMITDEPFYGNSKPNAGSKSQKLFPFGLSVAMADSGEKWDAAMIQLGRPMGLLHAHFQIPKGVVPRSLSKLNPEKKSCPLFLTKRLHPVHMEPQKRKRLK